jgi:hypothetical protein
MNPDLPLWQIPIAAWLIARLLPPLPSLSKQHCVRAGGKEERKLSLLSALVIIELLIIGQELGSFASLQEFAP